MTYTKSPIGFVSVVAALIVCGLAFTYSTSEAIDNQDLMRIACISFGWGFCFIGISLMLRTLYTKRRAKLDQE